MQHVHPSQQTWNGHDCGCRGEELLELIAKPTAKENAVVKRFKTEGGPSHQGVLPPPHQG